MKHKRVNLIIILTLTIGVLWYILKDHYQEIVDSVLNASFLWIIIAILLYALYTLFDVLNFHFLTKLYHKGVPLKFQIYLGIIGRFFSGITPLATGGQPMQVYELHKKGVSVTDGSNIAIQAYMIFQVALMFMGTVAIILNKALHLFADIPFLKQMTIIGFLINFGILAILLLISFSKTFNKKVICFFINLLAKIKIIKNKKTATKKWDKVCEQYHKNAKMLLNNKNVLFKCLLVEIISCLFYYLTPLALCYALGVRNIAWYAAVAASSYVFITGCYVPIPGATGGMEYSFAGLFGNFVGGYKLNALLVLWRFITYYFPVIFGGLTFNIKSSLSQEE
jgi:hypothetical protein